jgi:hypothetical protein
MEQVVDFLSHWLFVIFDIFRGWVGQVVALFDWPAQALGLPSEILAAAVLCVLLLVMWRTISAKVT